MSKRFIVTKTLTFKVPRILEGGGNGHREVTIPIGHWIGPGKPSVLSRCQQGTPKQKTFGAKEKARAERRKPAHGLPGHQYREFQTWEQNRPAINEARKAAEEREDLARAAKKAGIGKPVDGDVDSGDAIGIERAAA